MDAGRGGSGAADKQSDGERGTHSAWGQTSPGPVFANDA